ncbi:MAG: ATP-binding protein [Bacteriovorax sp.]|nr:ATP-binding protein [Bacteriovorax sp.]
MENENSLKRILDIIPCMVGYWDKDLKNKYSNALYLNFFNKSEKEIYNKHIKDVIGDDLYEKNLVYIEGALAGVRQSFEREISLPNNEKRFTQAEYIPDIVEGVVQGFSVLVTDINNLKKIEKEKEVMYQKLIQNSKMISLGEMAGGIAHEINNPLCVINFNTSTALELLDSDTLEKQQLISLLSKNQKMNTRIEKIITGLQFFSHERPSDNFTKASLVTILEDTTAFCLQKFKSKKINYSETFEGENFYLECMPVQISQVLLNLLNNAADAIETKAEKWIAVKIKDKEHLIEISITDSGTGMEPQIAEKIMEPFFTTKEVGRGTGLGLSISKGIIEYHKGSFVLDTQSNNTSFLITLPKVRVKNK